MRFVTHSLPVLLLALVPALGAADATKPNKVAKEEKREMKLAGDAPAKEDKREMKRSGDGPAREERANASDIQAKIQSRLRERLEITDDAEWAVVSERIKRVEELRRTVAGGVISAIDRAKRATRGEGVGAEREALRAAIADRLTDAEIRSRLSRVSEVHKQNIEKLDKAQDELRSVLTVRQEAVAVLFGILQP